MSQDARQRTKVYLDTYLTPANVTKDDDSTKATFVVMFGFPDYPVSREFNDNQIDLIFSVAKSVSDPLLDSDQVPCLYGEAVPITVSAVDKTGITGVKLNWKGVKELKRVCETYPEGSQRSLDVMRETTLRMGGTTIYQTECMLSYVRDTST